VWRGLENGATSTITCIFTCVISIIFVFILCHHTCRCIQKVMQLRNTVCVLCESMVPENTYLCEIKTVRTIESWPYMIVRFFYKNTSLLYFVHMNSTAGHILYYSLKLCIAVKWQSTWKIINKGHKLNKISNNVPHYLIHLYWVNAEVNMFSICTLTLWGLRAFFSLFFPSILHILLN